MVVRKAPHNGRDARHCIKTLNAAHAFDEGNSPSLMASFYVCEALAQAGQSTTSFLWHCIFATEWTFLILAPMAPHHSQQ